MQHQLQTQWAEFVLLNASTIIRGRLPTEPLQRAWLRAVTTRSRLVHLGHIVLPR